MWNSHQLGRGYRFWGWRKRVREGKRMTNFNFFEQRSRSELDLLHCNQSIWMNESTMYFNFFCFFAIWGPVSVYSSLYSQISRVHFWMMKWLFKMSSSCRCRFPGLKKIWDSPGGPVVKNLPCSAEKVGIIPARGTKNPHAVEQLGQHTAITEAWPHLEGPCASKSPHGATKVLHAATWYCQINKY